MAVNLARLNRKRAALLGKTDEELDRLSEHYTFLGDVTREQIRTFLEERRQVMVDASDASDAQLTTAKANRYAACSTADKVLWDEIEAGEQPRLKDASNLANFTRLLDLWLVKRFVIEAD